MVLVYLRNQQLDRHANFIDSLEAKGEAIGFRNPDYWDGLVEDVNGIYTDFPHILNRYREAGIDAYRISTDGLSLAELAEIKGIDYEEKPGGWHKIDGENVQGEDKARQTLEQL